jgi:hypothetical protein
MRINDTGMTHLEHLQEVFAVFDVYIYIYVCVCVYVCMYV